MDDLLLQELVGENPLGDDFDMLLPAIDGVFMGDEEADGRGLDEEQQSRVSETQGKVVEEPAMKRVKREPRVSSNEENLNTGTSSSSGLEDKKDSKRPPVVRGVKTGITTKGAASEAEKKAARRKQIAAASRLSRARRKQELEDLREENKKLREERLAFMGKIGDLQVKVENMREMGSTDMRVENALLCAQLEEHKRFVACFKNVCDGVPTTLNAKHLIYKQGSDAAQAQVLGLISQSLADQWIPGNIPPEANIPYQNFQFHFKFKNDYGEKSSNSKIKGEPNPRQRLNVRIDVSFPGFGADSVADFVWNSLSNTDMQQRLYRVNNLELTQLADDMPDENTKMVYFREKVEAPGKDQDWVVLCNRRQKELANSTLLSPSEYKGRDAGAAALDLASAAGNGTDASESDDTASSIFSASNLFSTFFGRSSTSTPLAGSAQGDKKKSTRVNATVLAMSSTQHSAAPHFENANRITSMFVQGAVAWSSGGDAQLIIVFSFPDDFSIKAMQRLEDVITPNGTMTMKFANVIKEFNEMLGEQDGNDQFVL